MWANKISRTEFVDLVGRIEQGTESPLKADEITPREEPNRGQCWVIWATQALAQHELPAALVVRNDDVEDFVAWAATFFASFRPFTSYFRLLSWRSFERATEVPLHPNLGNLSNAFIGLILGEALTHTLSRASMHAMPVHAFESTFSYSMARAIATGWDDTGAVCDGWNRLWKVTEQAPRKIALTELNKVWADVLCARTEEHSALRQFPPNLTNISHAFSELAEQQKLSPQIWNSLSRGRFDFFNLHQEMSKNRELRVRSFDQLSQELMSREGDSYSDAFLCGYVASLLSDGTLDHADLLFPLVERLPTVLIWYGVCAGLAKNSRIRGTYNGLGYRLLRDLLRSESIVSRPDSDIAIEELQALLRGVNGAGEFRQSRSAWLSVELVPHVRALVRWPHKRQETTQLDLMPESKSANANVLQELGMLLERAATLNRELISHSKEEPSPSPKRPPKKTRGKKVWW